MVEKNGTRNLTYLLIAVIGGGGGGAGGTWAYFSSLAPSQIEAMARPDPFTGIQAQGLINRIERLERHTDNHPDEANKFDSRITRLEANQNTILKNQDRILNRLDRP